MGEVTACHKEYLKFRPKKEKTAVVVATFPRHIHDESIHTHTHLAARMTLQQQQSEATAAAAVHLCPDGWICVLRRVLLVGVG